MKKTSPRGNFPAADEYRYRRTLGMQPDTRFKATGEYRYPQKGDWYLSGSIIEAYLSPATLSYPYWIAKPVLMTQCPNCAGCGKVETEP